MMTHLKKKISCLFLVLAASVGCLASHEEDKVMIEHLTTNNFLQGRAEIVFLLDRSGSVGAAEYEIEKGFVESFLTHIVVDINASRVAVISYSDTVVRHIDYLKEPKSRCFLAQEMHDVVYQDSGATNIAAALEEARAVFKNARPNVNKVVVLVSDGFANRGDDPAVSARKLKTEGAQIFCFGVGRFMRSELLRIASSLKHVYTCAGFKEFKQLARRIRGDPHESSWSSHTSKPNCDHLCESIYKGEPDDPGCCDHDARCSCALQSGLHTCVCKPGYYGLSGLIGNCRACPRGTYKSKLEPSDSCTTCPEGSTTAEIASIKLSDCYCKEGFVGDPAKGIPCKKIDCPLLQPPANGYIVGDCNTAYGSECHFTCEMPSYELEDSSSDIRWCQSNGQWSGKTVVCLEARCNPLPNPKNGYVSCDAVPLTVGKKCFFQCERGYVRKGSAERECASSNSWSGKETKCIPLTCNVPPRLVHGIYRGCSENQRPNFYETCIYTCNRGYRLDGPRYLTCRGDGRLLDQNGREEKPQCTDITAPEIICPRPITVETDRGRNSAKVNWEVPLPTDNTGLQPKLITSPPNIFPGQMFPIGFNQFQYIAIDQSGNRASCSVHVEVLDREPPAVLECPGKIEIGTNDVSVPVYWKEPIFKDNSNRPLTIFQTIYSGSKFGQGSQTVQYAADDESGNRAFCMFDVIVSRNSCPYYPPPDNGAIACNDYMFGEMCQVYCNEKYDFVRNPSEWYICNVDAQWETYPPSETIPWPNCARPVLPAAIRQTVGLHYTGDCNDAEVQAYIKKRYLSHIYSSVKYSYLCQKIGSCHVNKIQVRCGQMTDNFKRNKRDVWEFAEKEHLELEFEITIRGDEKFNDTEAVLQDFLAVIRNLKWDLDEDLNLLTTMSPLENDQLSTERRNITEALTVTDKNTILICQTGSVEIDDSCVLCSAGTFYDSANKKCVDCPVGYYQENQGQLQCEKCPENTNTESPRTLNGTLCKDICPLGTYSKTGLETCISCSVGKYQDSKGKDSCNDCPSGTTTESVGATSIEDCKDVCEPGSFSQNGLQPCDPCPLHHFQPLAGEVLCLECPNELSTAEIGANEINMCIDLNPCLLEYSCLNNGSCTIVGRDAKCKCTQGFEGIYCEKDIDECDSTPCSNGGFCINTEGAFYCKCKDGFTGKECDIEIDECTSTPCKNQGTCMNKVNGYTCVCTNVFEGANCEIQRELCFRDIVCLNGGVCMFEKNGNSSICVCEPGFAGMDCSFNINECENVTCKNNGSCIDGIYAFTCDCSAGYTGKFCETDIDECENNLCSSGSTCLDLIGTYTCLCLPGWNGTHCESKIDSDFILMFPESAATVANMASMTLNSPLTDATISLWIQTNDTERSGTPLSYAVASTSTIGADRTIIDNALTISDCSEVKVYINNEPVVTDLQVADGQWHHLAFTWSSENFGMWALYKDGEIQQEGKNLQPNKFINGGGNMVIGQEQDTIGGGFSPLETFTGNITRVNIWNNYFSQSNITRLCKLDDELPDKILAWPDFLHGLKGDVQVLQNSRPMIDTTNSE